MSRGADVDQMRDDCALCVSNYRSNHSESPIAVAEKAHLLFHKYCPTCSEEPEDERLCRVCRHLRLRHCNGCVETENVHGYDFILNPEVLGTASLLECPLCLFVRHTIEVGMTPEAISEFISPLTKVTLIIGSPYNFQPKIHLFNTDRSPPLKIPIWTFLPIAIEDTIKACAKPEVRAFVDWPYLRCKIEDCEREHIDCRKTDSSRLPHSFRVIDVKRRCLVETIPHDFVVLSYVWGNNVGRKLLAATMKTLQQMKAVGGIPVETTPKTVEDAMTICDVLGERYLWIDRLCIVQDDQDEKQKQMGAMADVFSSAKLVIIAAYGKDMDYGIPGVGHPRDIVQIHQDIGRVRITNVIGEVRGDRNNVWRTRGWTYQEGVLARRRVFLGRHRSLFECQASLCREDRFNIQKHLSLSSNLLVAPEENSQFDAYKRHIYHYTARNLTYLQDACNAISGILHALYDGHEGFTHGLPNLHFDRALLWNTSEYSEGSYSEGSSYFQLNMRKIAAPQVGVHEDLMIPSWSWSFAMSKCQSVTYIDDEFYGSLVRWYMRPLVDTDFVLISIPTDQALSSHDDWPFYMAMAASHGCLESLPLSIDLTSQTFAEIGEKFQESFRGLFYPYVNMRPVKPSGFDVSKKDENRLAQRDGLIYGRWQTAQLLLAPYFSSPQQCHSAMILNHRGEEIGTLLETRLQSPENFFSDVWEPEASFEFGAISLSGTSIPQHYTSKKQSKCYVDVNGIKPHVAPIVNVLMVRHEGGTTYRQALGYVYLMDWVNEDREWKDVALG